MAEVSGWSSGNTGLTSNLPILGEAMHTGLQLCHCNANLIACTERLSWGMALRMNVAQRIRSVRPLHRQQCSLLVRMAIPGTQSANSSDYEERCIGTLLWKACADALGSAAEGQIEPQVRADFPQGLVRYAHSSRPKGCYTDDTQMALALARSLVEVGHLDPGHVSAKYAEDFEMWRGYGGTAQAILSRLKQGDADWRTVSREYFPEGSFANGGAMRIAPLGLAYRHAPPAVLRKAVEGALHCTHVHPEAIDGAVVIAAACAWLAKQPAPQFIPAAAGRSSGSTAAAALQGTESGCVAPNLVCSEEQRDWAVQLLEELLTHTQTDAMKERLDILLKMFIHAEPPQSAVTPADHPASADGSRHAETSSTSGNGTAGSHAQGTPVTIGAAAAPAESCQALQDSWAPYLNSPAWTPEVEQAYQLSGEVFQIRAVDAVPMVLYAFCRHGLSQHPAIACVAAIHYGGDTDTIAAMTGALLGATYGRRYLPQEWLTELENGHALGRDGIIQLGRQLSTLDVTE